MTTPPVARAVPVGAAAACLLAAGLAAANAGDLPVDQIEALVGADGHVSNGVLHIPLERTDIGEVQGPRGVTFTPSFGVHGDLWFQPRDTGGVLLNGDLALLPEEVNPFISTLQANGLLFQAFHQHFPMTNPPVWHVHFRGLGDSSAVASAVHAAIAGTDTPLPQSPPANPTSPLDAERLATILHGDAEIGNGGVVTVTVNRAGLVILDALEVRPEAGISSTIEFDPTGGSDAAVVAAFSMTSEEVNGVATRMLNQLDWFQGGLNSQETAEYPQLYVDHMLKTGDAYALAMEIRSGLDLTNAE